MFQFIFLAACVAALALPGAARAEQGRVQTRDAFVALIKDRALTRLGVSLNVSTDGRITGKAFGRPVTGDWKWSDGYFCRDMVFGNQPIGPNCQLVENRGGALRFTSDKGKGDFADLRLR
ncbi:MAG: dihydrodipicolinate reductase [Gemmobacter sp.]|nr:dihydrodipicolinate reductase [Gemmobacter sp.]